MDFATRIILYFVDYALVDEGGRNSIRIQMENVKFSCHSFFFCAHCRVVFSLCTSGPTDSHFISHSKLDMTGKWALPLGILIEFYWASGTTRIVHLFRRSSSCRRGWPNHIARVGEGGRSYILGTHYGLTGIFFPQE